MTEPEASVSKPIVHRKPTLSTVRQLYGTAFRCGMPECGRPLFRIDDETGDAVLNSHVSHICARSEGGPRWDPQMSEADNRDAANLIPMCMEHAYEIDQAPERFPVELLHYWKRLQIAEHQEVQKGWPLTDDEAVHVIEESFNSADYGVALTTAASVTALARAVGRLVQTARQQREQPATAAAAWHAMRAESQARSLPAWDGETGELLPPPEPSVIQTQPFREALVESLRDVVEILQPLLVDVVAELHAVQAVSKQLQPWCEWVEAAATRVIGASGRWPGPPPQQDDEELTAVLSELGRASAALSATWRGEPSEQPPVLTTTTAEPLESEAQGQLRKHGELLDRARPWARVDTRGYDAQLYADLVDAATYAVKLPKTMTHMRFGLDVTAGLAASVARNADDATLAELIDAATNRLPLAVAVYLLRQLMFMAEQTNRAELYEKASHHLTQLLIGADWADRDLWVENRHYVRLLLSFTASISSDAEVGGLVEAALEADSSLLEPILEGVSEHEELRDSQNLHQVIAIVTRISDVPAWFPTSAVARAIRFHYPDLSPDDRGSLNDGSETLRLATQLLDIDSRAT
ncbi:hypothetical protein [Nocardia sp. CA-119907]|uniref:hypothetical protein n=1 Tax=Nocardia sp. CA-119907 TaxID=3239973 RepID=UPI003D95458A